jgi:tRNA/rRNA methyltransferase
MVPRGAEAKVITFILHEPQLPENLGATARAMANFGFADLRVVAPHCDRLDPTAIAMSVGADSILESATVFESLDDAVADLNWLYGTCATQRHLIKEYLPIRQASQRIQTHFGNVGVLFGPERTGLSNEILARCHGVIQIPVNPEFSSMNLAQAMVIIAYELSQYPRQSDVIFNTGETCPAPQGQLQAFLTYLEKELDAVDYWRVPSKKTLMKQNLENVFTRLQVTEQDIRSLWGMIDRLRGR